MATVVKVEVADCGSCLHLFLFPAAHLGFWVAREAAVAWAGGQDWEVAARAGLVAEDHMMGRCRPPRGCSGCQCLP